MTAAYGSVLDLSFEVRAGLLVRQVHHWAALVFVAALMIHLLRMFFTGAYRKPRVINWLIGIVLLIMVGMNGLFGYSLPDDLLSGVGLRVAYSITESIPILGPWLASMMFGGEFPTDGIIARIYPVHILLLPLGIMGLLGLHLGIMWFQRHTEFPGPARDDRTMVGTPMVPAYALRTLGYFLLIAGVLTAFGAFLQINPVWLYGPFTPFDATTQAQPDWYMGWMEGGLRLMPGWDIRIGWFVLPAVFWPAVILPGLVFTPLLIWPFVDQWAQRDHDYHNVLTLAHGAPRPHGAGRRLRDLSHGAAAGRRRRRVRQRVEPGRGDGGGGAARHGVRGAAAGGRRDVRDRPQEGGAVAGGALMRTRSLARAAAPRSVPRPPLASEQVVEHRGREHHGEVRPGHLEEGPGAAGRGRSQEPRHEDPQHRRRGEARRRRTGRRTARRPTPRPRRR